MSTNEIKEKILRSAFFINSQEARIDDLILNDNMDENSIRDAISDLKSLRENFHNNIDKITLEQWREILK